MTQPSLKTSLPDYLKHERETRDRQAPQYEGWISPYQHEAEWRAYRGVIESWRGSVIDVGCGTGRVTRKIASAAKVVGVDFSPVSLDVARNLTPGGKNIQYVEGDVRYLPFEDNSFDHAISIQVYEHLLDTRDVQILFNEIARVLTPEGSALVSGYSYSLWDRLRGQKRFEGQDEIRFVRYTPEEVEKFAQNAGLSVVKHRNIIVFTRTVIRNIAALLPDKALVTLDSWLSPFLGQLWGAITVLELKKVTSD